MAHDDGTDWDEGDNGAGEYHGILAGTRQLTVGAVSPADDTPDTLLLADPAGGETTGDAALILDMADQLYREGFAHSTSLYAPEREALLGRARRAGWRPPEERT